MWGNTCSYSSPAFQNRVRELEAELDGEIRRAKEAFANARKYERQFKELQVQSEEDKRMILELQDLLDKTQIKMKAYKRQLDEQVRDEKYLVFMSIDSLEIVAAEFGCNLGRQSIKKTIIFNKFVIYTAYIDELPIVKLTSND